MLKKILLKIDNYFFLGLPPLLLYITLHTVSETTFVWKAVGSCIVTVEKVLTNITEKCALNHCQKFMI